MQLFLVRSNQFIFNFSRRPCLPSKMFSTGSSCRAREGALVGRMLVLQAWRLQCGSSLPMRKPKCSNAPVSNPSAEEAEADRSLTSLTGQPYWIRESRFSERFCLRNVRKIYLIWERSRINTSNVLSKKCQHMGSCVYVTLPKHESIHSGQQKGKWARSWQWCKKL